MPLWAGRCPQISSDIAISCTIFLSLIVFDEYKCFVYMSVQHFHAITVEARREFQDSMELNLQTAMSSCVDGGNLNMSLLIDLN